MGGTRDQQQRKRPTSRVAGARRRTRKPPVVRNIGLLLLVAASIIMGIIAIRMWVDVAGGQQVVTGTVAAHSYISTRCGRGGARCDTYRIDVADSGTPNRTFTIDQGAYEQLTVGDHVRLTVATAAGDVYRVEKMQDGHWTILSDSGAPGWQVALALTLLTLVGIFFSDMRYHHRTYDLAWLRAAFGKPTVKKGAPDLRQRR